jgi:hypothetical protein
VEPVLRFPPSPELDEEFAQSKLNLAYNEFTKLSSHTMGEIKAFESRQLDLLSKRRDRRCVNRNIHKSDHKPKPSYDKPTVDTKYYAAMERPKEPPSHIRLPKETGRISKLSIVWLYAAIVYTVLRDLIDEYQISVEDDRWFASVVYSFYSFVVAQDDRKLVNPIRWLKILEDVQDHGFRAAASRNYVVSTYCKKCTNIEKKIFVMMELRGKNSEGRWCKKCGGTDAIKVSVTPKYIHNKINAVKKRIKQFNKHFSSYMRLMNYLSIEIKNDPYLRRLFQEYFRMYEIAATKSSFHKYEYYFMGHYDKSKKSKRRWCSLTKDDILTIEVDDPNYKDLIKKLSEPYENSDRMRRKELTMLLNYKLNELNWPSHLRSYKIGIDVESMHILQSTVKI